MSVNDSTWSYGESKLFNSDYMITEPDDAWVYGENELLHVYELRFPSHAFTAEHIDTHFIAEHINIDA